jgi:8-oxo-dGTP diphosphatase
MANQRERKRRKQARAPIEGAGGVVVRDGAAPLIAIVQRRKDNGWVLPKGKLKPGESAIAAAEREVFEETGCSVRVQDFLGVVSYKAASGKPKVVQFWRMQAAGGAARKLMPDIKAVKWLSLESAIAKLDDPLERLFLRNVGRRALASAAPSEPPTTALPAPPAIVQPGQEMIPRANPSLEQPTALVIPEPTLTFGPHPDTRRGEAAVDSKSMLAQRPEPTAGPNGFAKPTRPSIIQTVQSVAPSLLDRIWQWLHPVATDSTRRHPGSGAR